MLYLFIIFLSAFLLFQVQPLIAKLILPLFGGGAAIWTACLLFFQAFLLLGYLYAHILSKCKNLSVQVVIHSVILFTSLFFMPIGLKQLSTFNQLSPLSDILQLLVLSIGVPYFLLSSTGPLVQKWLSYVYASKPNFTPYKLYSLSNIGSLLALLSYPFIFEPLFSLPNQLMYWSAGYILLVLLLIAFCFQLFALVSSVSSVSQSHSNEISNDDVNENNTVFNTQVIGFKFDWLLWLALSATGVVLLVSITNAMTQNIPPVPFLWILPLSLYLLTFIISFHSPKWYVRWYWYAFFVLSSFAGVLMFFIGSQFDIISQVIIYSAILLSSCMICHGELVKIKPSTERLTLFYLNMSLGGFLGSAFVAFVAQQLFTQFLEFPIALVSVFILFALCVWLARNKQTNNNTIEDKSSFLLAASSVVFAVVLVGGFVSLNSQFKENTIELSRNFYGLLSVKDVEVNGQVERRLIDGTTSHGTQSLNQEKSLTPMSYYRKNTGVALALEHLFLTPTKSVGLIGLGAGTLATYGNRGDRYTFYELNPNVERMARKYFSYIEASKANVDVIIGDARVTLQNELLQNSSKATNNKFDVLVVDAFSGDSVPAHLLTHEAFLLYTKHMKQQGLLAIHVSNSHLDLTPLVKGLANSIGYQAVYFKTKVTESEVTQTEWVIVTNNKAFLRTVKVQRLMSEWPENIDGSVKQDVVWTDDYSNLLSVLK